VYNPPQTKQSKRERERERERGTIQDKNWYLIQNSSCGGRDTIYLIIKKINNNKIYNCWINNIFKTIGWLFFLQ
jgi:hypothetical protein